MLEKGEGSTSSHRKKPVEGSAGGEVPVQPIREEVDEVGGDNRAGSKTAAQDIHNVDQESHLEGKPGSWAAALGKNPEDTRNTPTKIIIEVEAPGRTTAEIIPQLSERRVKGLGEVGGIPSSGRTLKDFLQSGSAGIEQGIQGWVPTRKGLP